jgi:hypothetical protein
MFLRHQKNRSRVEAYRRPNPQREPSSCSILYAVNLEICYYTISLSTIPFFLLFVTGVFEVVAAGALALGIETLDAGTLALGILTVDAGSLAFFFNLVDVVEFSLSSEESLTS